MMPPMPPPTPTLPGEVIMSGVESNTTYVVQTYGTVREVTVHVSNKDRPTGAATLNLMVNSYADEYHVQESREVGGSVAPVPLKDQHDITTKDNNKCQHFTALIPPGVKAVIVELANYVSGKFTVTISKRF